MAISPDRIVIIVGNYGSGKSEVSVNLALKEKKGGAEVNIVDLDLVNPYFRSREAEILLASRGIKSTLPPRQYFHADLPILDPAVAGAIKKPGGLLIIDAGGDDSGVTVLASLNNVLKDKKIEMLMVVNPFRPMTRSVERCLKIKEEIENSSKLKVTGLISNANLIGETTVEHIYEGYEFIKSVSSETGLPIEFITAESRFMPEIETSRFSCPVMPLNRRLVPPWLAPVDE